MFDDGRFPGTCLALISLNLAASARVEATLDSDTCEYFALTPQTGLAFPFWSPVIAASAGTVMLAGLNAHMLAA